MQSIDVYWLLLHITYYYSNMIPHIHTQILVFTTARITYNVVVHCGMYSSNTARILLLYVLLLYVLLLYIPQCTIARITYNVLLCVLLTTVHITTYCYSKWYHGKRKPGLHAAPTPPFSLPSPAHTHRVPTCIIHMLQVIQVMLHMWYILHMCVYAYIHICVGCVHLWCIIS